MAQPSTALNPSSLSALIWIYTILAVIAVSFRTFVRYKVSRNLELDDILVFAALLCLISMAVLYMWAIPAMYTLEDVLHEITKPGPNFQSEASLFLRCQFALILLFWTSLWLVKFSFLAFYKRLFSQVRGTLMHCWWATVVVCAVTYLGCWVLQFLSCNPLLNYFTVGSCESPRDILYSNTSMWYSTAADIFSDVLIMALPLRILFNLKLDMRKKLALGCVFGAGIFILIIAILRIIFTRPGESQVNPIWLSIWSPTEITVAIIVSCSPAFRVLLVRHESQQGNSGAMKFNRHDNSVDSYEQRMVDLENIRNLVTPAHKVRTPSKRSSNEEMTALPDVSPLKPRTDSTVTMLSAQKSTQELPV